MNRGTTTAGGTMPLKKINIIGIPVSPAHSHELHAGISEIIGSGRPGVVLSGNVHGLNLAYKLAWLKEFYQRADIVRVDGAGIVWAAGILGSKIPSRLTWADWGWLFAEYVASRGYSLFLLGGPQNTAELTAALFRKRNPGIKIVGTHHGYFQKQGVENEALIQEINDLRPDILVVGMGMPLQEQWILSNSANINAKVIITCGAAFEYLSGTKKRCPEWMGRLGFEWLYRFSQEPRRMAKRYIWGNIIFMLRILRQHFQEN